MWQIVSGSSERGAWSPWNKARSEAELREQVIGALATYLADTRGVQEQVIAEIESGLASWESAVANGNRPPPYFFRHTGSDTAPEMWTTFEQMQLNDLFDPVTLFDLAFFFSELDGVGRKYIRYVTFVEDEILPGTISDEDIFYDQNGRLKAKFHANMAFGGWTDDRAAALQSWCEGLFNAADLSGLKDFRN